MTFGDALKSPCILCRYMSDPSQADRSGTHWPVSAGPTAEPVCANIVSVHYARRCRRVTVCTSRIVAMVETTGSGNGGWLR